MAFPDWPEHGEGPRRRISSRSSRGSPVRSGASSPPVSLLPPTSSVSDGLRRPFLETQDSGDFVCEGPKSFCENDAQSLRELVVWSCQYEDDAHSSLPRGRSKNAREQRPDGERDTPETVLEQLKRVVKHVFFRSCVPLRSSDDAESLERSRGQLTRRRSDAGVRLACICVSRTIQELVHHGAADVRSALWILLVVHRLSLQVPVDISTSSEVQLDRVTLLLQHISSVHTAAGEKGARGDAHEDKATWLAQAGDSQLVAAYAGWLEQKLLTLRNLDLFFTGNWSLHEYFEANGIDGLPAFCRVAVSLGMRDAEDGAMLSPVSVAVLERLSCRLLLPGLSLCRVFLSKAETPFFQLCAPILCHLADDVWGLFSVVFHFYVLLVSLAKEEKESRSLRQEGDAGRNSRVDVSEPCVLFTRRLRSLALGLAEVVRRLLEVTEWSAALSSHMPLLSRLRPPSPALLSVIEDLLRSVTREVCPLSSSCAARREVRIPSTEDLLRLLPLPGSLLQEDVGEPSSGRNCAGRHARDAQDQEGDSEEHIVLLPKSGKVQEAIEQAANGGVFLPRQLENSAPDGQAGVSERQPRQNCKTGESMPTSKGSTASESWRDFLGGDVNFSFYRLLTDNRSRSLASPRRTLWTDTSGKSTAVRSSCLRLLPIVGLGSELVTSTPQPGAGHCASPFRNSSTGASSRMLGSTHSAVAHTDNYVRGGVRKGGTGNAGTAVFSKMTRCDATSGGVDRSDSCPVSGSPCSKGIARSPVSSFHVRRAPAFGVLPVSPPRADAYRSWPSGDQTGSGEDEPVPAEGGNDCCSAENVEPTGISDKSFVDNKERVVTGREGGTVSPTSFCFVGDSKRRDERQEEVHRADASETGDCSAFLLTEPPGDHESRPRQVASSTRHRKKLNRREGNSAEALSRDSRVGAEGKRYPFQRLPGELNGTEALRRPKAVSCGRQDESRRPGGDRAPGSIAHQDCVVGRAECFAASSSPGRDRPDRSIELQTDQPWPGVTESGIAVVPGAEHNSETDAHIADGTERSSRAVASFEQDLLWFSRRVGRRSRRTGTGRGRTSASRERELKADRSRLVRETTRTGSPQSGGHCRSEEAVLPRYDEIPVLRDYESGKGLAGAVLYRSRSFGSGPSVGQTVRGNDGGRDTADPSHGIPCLSRPRSSPVRKCSPDARKTEKKGAQKGSEGVTVNSLRELEESPVGPSFPLSYGAAGQHSSSVSLQGQLGLPKSDFVPPALYPSPTVCLKNPDGWGGIDLQPGALAFSPCSLSPLWPVPGSAAGGEGDAVHPNSSLGGAVADLVGSEFCEDSSSIYFANTEKDYWSSSSSQPWAGLQFVPPASPVFPNDMQYPGHPAFALLSGCPVSGGQFRECPPPVLPDCGLSPLVRGPSSSAPVPLQDNFFPLPVTAQGLTHPSFAPVAPRFSVDNDPWGLAVEFQPLSAVSPCQASMQQCLPRDENWEVDIDELCVGGKIGCGASSEVFSGTWRGSEVAIKKLTLPENDATRKAVRDFEREMQIMLRLRHPNLVLLMGAHLRSRPLFVVTELCTGGSLFELLHGQVVFGEPAMPCQAERARNGRGESREQQAEAKGGRREGGDGEERASRFCRVASPGPTGSNENTQDKEEISSPSSLWRQSNRRKLSWWQKAKIAFDVAKGCAYLHGSRPPVVHRDLKSMNILLTEQITHEQQIPHAKVADFGLSRVRTVADTGRQPLPSTGCNHAVFSCSQSVETPWTCFRSPGLHPQACPPTPTAATGIVGTCYWMAPEVLIAGQYTEKVDVYSFGIVLYELLSEALPYCDYRSPAGAVHGSAGEIGTAERGARSGEEGESVVGKDREGSRSASEEDSSSDDANQRSTRCHAPKFSSVKILRLREEVTQQQLSSPRNLSGASSVHRTAKASPVDNEDSCAPGSSTGMKRGGNEFCALRNSRSRESRNRGEGVKDCHGLSYGVEEDGRQNTPASQHMRGAVSSGCRETVAPPPHDVCKRVARGERPDLRCIPADCPPVLLRLMQACWLQNAVRRPSFPAIAQMLRSFLQQQQQ